VNDLLTYGLFFGLIAAVGIYHLLMYAVLRTTDFLAYGAYLFALIAFQVARTPLVPPGDGQRWLFWWSFAAVAALGYWLFRSFLSLDELQPRLNRAFFGFTAVVVAASLVAPWVGGPIDRLLELAALGVLAVGLASIVEALRKGVRVAKFFGIAYAGLFLGAFARIGWQLGGDHLFPGAAVLGAWGIELGSTFQALTLALGIADRIATANEERDLAQRRTIDEISSLNVAYARFVPREFLELLGKDDVRDVALGDGVESEMTVLFTDVRSFTTLSEAMTPGETFGFINELLERTGPAVREHGGIVDKYVGDAIMALFPRAADDALRAAIAVQHGVSAYNAERARRGAAPVTVGVGLHRGRLMLGTIGESARMDGTVIADAVNAASRVEGLTKHFGAGIIISEAVFAALADPEAYAMRYLGRVAVQGKTQGLEIFEVLDADRPERRLAKIETIAQFAGAVKAFVAGSFVDAGLGFEDVLASDPDDRAARYLQGRAIELATSGEPWDGVDHAAK
jgi:class 3 adenylate cyclase